MRREYIVTAWATARNHRRLLHSQAVTASSKAAAEKSTRASHHAKGRRLVVIWSCSEMPR